MSLPEFLTSVQAAARFLPPPEVFTDGHGPDVESLRDALSKADIWLTPAAVSGFEPNDFLVLPDSDRNTLTQNVRHFEDVARQVASGQPATGSQVNEALPAFQTILNLLSPYLSPEGREVYRALWSVRGQFRDFVLGFDYELRSDSTGDPAVVVWVVVPDEFNPIDPAARRQESAVRAAIAKALAAQKINRWPYVRIQTRSEARDRLSTGVL